MEAHDWKQKLPPGSRQKVVAHIIEKTGSVLQLPEDGLNKLNLIASKLEEQIFTNATSIKDYQSKLYMKLRSMEKNFRRTGGPNSSSPNSAGSSQNQQLPASQTMQSQVRSPSQIPSPLPQESSLVSQNNIIVKPPVQCSGSLSSMICSTQPSMQNAISQNCNSFSGISPDSAVNRAGKVPQRNILPNSKQSQNSQQFIPQRQPQHFHPQPTQRAHPSSMQSIPPSDQKNQQSAAAKSTSSLQKIPQLVSRQLQHQPTRQTPIMHQKQRMVHQQAIFPSEQGQPRTAQQPNARNLQNQRLGPQNGFSEVQRLQQQQGIQRFESTNSTAPIANEVVDWQEETYQKIKSLKEMYLPDLSALNQKVSLKCQQIYSQAQLANTEKEKIDRFRIYKHLLGSLITFLNLSKCEITRIHKDKLDACEKRIIHVLNNRPGSSVTPLPQIQRSGRELLLKQQLEEPEIPQLKQHENQMNSQMHPTVVPQKSSTVAVKEENVDTMSQSRENGTKPYGNSEQINPNMHQQISKHQNPQLQHQFLANRPLKRQQSAVAPLEVHQMVHIHQRREARQAMSLKPGSTQQHLSSPQFLQVTHPHISQGSSPHIEQRSLLSSHSKTEIPMSSANSSFVVLSSTPTAPFPLPGDHERRASGVSPLSNAGNIGQQQNITGISSSPLLPESSCPDGHLANATPPIKLSGIEQPLERLMKVVKSVSSKALTVSLSDMESVVTTTDWIAEFPPVTGSVASVGEDSMAFATCSSTQDSSFITCNGSSGRKKMKRKTSATPVKIGFETSDLESTATSRMSTPWIEANHVLLEEIRKINHHLIETVVDIVGKNDDLAATMDGEGTVIRCSYTAAALSPELKSLYTSGMMSQILPLRMLVPTNYPNSLPVLLDKIPAELSEECEDLSAKARSRFSLSMRCLSEPMSLEDIVKTWDICVRAVISDFVQKRGGGGGSFSSRYCTWEEGFCRSVLPQKRKRHSKLLGQFHGRNDTPCLH